MTLTNEERTLLLLYSAADRSDTIRTIREMQTCLQPDEKELGQLAEGLIQKLAQMTDPQFAALDLFDGLDWRRQHGET